MRTPTETSTLTALPNDFEMQVNAWSTPGDCGASVPVLCLHSLFFTGEMFRPVADTLSIKWTIFAPTYRGHGRQSTGGKSPTVAQLARDIVDWLGAAQIDRVHLIGSSMGAYVAMELLRDQSDRIASVVLACCTCEAEADPDRFDKLAAFIASGPRDTTGQVIAEVMFGRDSLGAPSPLVESWTARFGATPPEMAEAVAAMFAHPGYGDVLRAYAGPVLLVAGAQDRAKSVADMEHIATHLPQAERCVFDAVGHTPAVEAPDAFAARVATFLAQVDARHPAAPSPQTADRNHVA